MTDTVSGISLPLMDFAEEVARCQKSNQPKKPSSPQKKNLNLSINYKAALA